MQLEQRLRNALAHGQQEEIFHIFEEIYKKYSKLVYFKISQMISSKEDIEEITQDVFVKFYNSLNSSKINNIKYYLLAIAKNETINYLRKTKIKTINSDIVVYEKIDTKYDYGPIIEEMKIYLNEFEIEIIINHIIYNYTFKEIAKKHNKHEKTIQTSYYRAIKKMKKGGKYNEFQKEVC